MSVVLGTLWTRQRESLDDALGDHYDCLIALTALDLATTMMDSASHTVHIPATLSVLCRSILSTTSPI